MENLIKIQSELKAPKGQYNSFGKYKYRSAEDILEAVKPICAKYGCLLMLSDNVVDVGERYYVEATATLTTPGKKTFVVTAYAREDENKKGMDGSQITGTASSYARKYALNGLFCIDDTKDADTMDNTEKPKKAKVKSNIADALKKIADALTSKTGRNYTYVNDGSTPNGSFTTCFGTFTTRCEYLRPFGMELTLKSCTPFR